MKLQGEGRGIEKGMEGGIEKGREGGIEEEMVGSDGMREELREGSKDEEEGRRNWINIITVM